MMRVLEGKADDLQPLRRRLRAVDRRGRRGAARRAPLRLVLLRRRRRVPGRRRRATPSREASGSGGTTATGRRRTTSRPWSAPGRRRSATATKASALRSRSSARAGEGPARRRAGRCRRKASRSRAVRPTGAIRVLVGPWARLRPDPAAALIEAGPAESGVFADFARRGGAYALEGLDEDGKVARGFGSAAGLVAATRRYEGPPVWVVTGATPAGVQAAADLLDAAGLRDHYAVATVDGKETPLPVETPR